jgi:hypothetical protein
MRCESRMLDYLARSRNTRERRSGVETRREIRDAFDVNPLENGERERINRKF